MPHFGPSAHLIAGAPQWAALVAITNSTRVAAGKPIPSTTRRPGCLVASFRNPASWSRGRRRDRSGQPVIPLVGFVSKLPLGAGRPAGLFIGREAHCRTDSHQPTNLSGSVARPGEGSAPSFRYLLRTANRRPVLWRPGCSPQDQSHQPANPSDSVAPRDKRPLLAAVRRQASPLLC